MTTRIQLRRTKGWRKPANAVSIARPGPFGNPFIIRLQPVGWGTPKRRGWFVRELYDGLPCQTWGPWGTKINAARCAVLLYREWISKPEQLDLRNNIRDVFGHDEMIPACWCKPGDPCHATVIEEIAATEIED